VEDVEARGHGERLPDRRRPGEGIGQAVSSVGSFMKYST
jgi:hypothetical protein